MDRTDNPLTSGYESSTAVSCGYRPSRGARWAGATVRGTLVLPGGTHARTCLIQTADPEREFVLREFPPGDPAVGDEMRVLDALDGLGGLAPRLLAADPDGSKEGPWILISRPARRIHRGS